MNEAQKKKVEKILDTCRELANQIEEIQSDVQEAIDNCPENLQSSEAQSLREDQVGFLQDAVDHLANVDDALSSI
jgi:DNA-binding transcriptional regulator GbsR (MarR family)